MALALRNALATDIRGSPMCRRVSPIDACGLLGQQFGGCNSMVATYPRMLRVISAIHLIRPLFAAESCDVLPYGRGEIAAAMLELCPEGTDYWLSPGHLRSTFRALQTRSVSG